MCELNTENLIDLSNEDGFTEQKNISANQSGPSNTLSGTECHLQTVIEERESLDNNPFDFAQKLASRPQDPFDIVEKEVCVKARDSMHHSHDIKMGKLLSLSDDNILDDRDSHANESTRTDKVNQKAIIDINTINGSSTIYHTAIINDLDSESPPISMSIKSTPDTCSSAIESDESSANSADGYSANIRKALESRNRLLKLSIANSTFNSPLSSRPRPCDSGFSTIFSDAAHYSDKMLATESPLKLVEDDLMTEEPPNLQIQNAEQDFEADLKMLSIPMLRKLPSPVPEEISLVKKEPDEEATALLPQSMSPPDLSVLREKLRAKRIESGKSQDVVTLIDNLKSLLCGNDIVDGNKKEQANSLLQKLSSALNAVKTEDVNGDHQQKSLDSMESSMKAPQTIVRQGTFDMELQPSANQNCEYSSGVTAIVCGDISRMTHSTHLLSPPKEIPETMLKSSATYDSEPVAERENLLLPHVETISPIISPNIKRNLMNEAATSNPDINDIIEQISKLFEQHQIASQTSNGDGTNGKDLAGSNASQTSAICNPTFIVVMPTNNIQSNNKQNVDTVCDDFFEDINSSLAMRRRSQSLSLHDKVKIVQLPIRPQASISEADTSPYVGVGTQNNAGTMEIKTPMRTLRRNSFSLGTPHTPLTSLNHGTGITNTRRLPNVPIQSRYSLGPTKIQEREAQHQAVVHPIPRIANLNAFKPDLKKRSKQQSGKTSVMTSNAPLKAVMPIKKVGPLLTATMATPERPLGNVRLQSQKASMETSMHLLTKSGKISNTSTPMSTARNSDQINEIPNACSTPAFASGAVRSSGTVTKKNSRFSNSNSTPTLKLQQPYHTSSSGLKKRHLPELTKAKSPVRMRNSLAGMPVQVVKGRQSIKLPTIPKQTDSRLSIRPNLRSSYGGSITSTNKENKKP